jgi:hypothetical protein
VGANALVLFAVVVENFQLLHPVYCGHQTYDKENPIQGVGSPPTLHKAEKIVGGKKVVYK